MSVFNKFGLVSTVILSGVISMSSHVSAQSGGDVGSGPNPFSDCGIGAALFKNDVGASISNVIWDLGTTAVTSALSSPETCEGDSVAAAEFIYETYASLEEQTAKGQGSNLTAVLEIMQCDDQSHAGLISDIRSDFVELVSVENYSDMTNLERSEQFYNMVSSHTASACGVS